MADSPELVYGVDRDRAPSTSPSTMLHGFSSTRRVRPARAARGARVGGQIVLLHLERGHYFTMNATGSWIWDRISDGASLGELRDSVVDHFAVEPDRAWNDLVTVIGELEEERLVELEADRGIDDP